MNRRTVLIGAGGIANVVLAGCLGDDDDEPSDHVWEEVAEWLEVAVETLDETRNELVSWRESPDAEVIPTLSNLADDAYFALEEFEDVFEGREGVIPEWDFTASDNGNEWHVDGELLFETVEELFTLLDDVITAFERINQANGDPDHMLDHHLETVDGIIDAEGVIDDGWALLGR